MQHGELLLILLSSIFFSFPRMFRVPRMVLKSFMWFKIWYLFSKQLYRCPGICWPHSYTLSLRRLSLRKFGRVLIIYKLRVRLVSVFSPKLLFLFIMFWKSGAKKLCLATMYVFKKSGSRIHFGREKKWKHQKIVSLIWEQAEPSKH